MSTPTPERPAIHWLRVGPKLLAVCKAILANAEKAVSPAARLYGYEALKAAVKEAEGTTP